MDVKVIDLNSKFHDSCYDAYLNLCEIYDHYLHN